METTNMFPDKEQVLIKVRTEETSTQLSTCYYEVVDVVPFGWGRMSDEEKHHWLRRNAKMINRVIEDTKVDINGVFDSWGDSDPEWTVTFTYTASEVVNAASRADAITKARKILASIHQSAENVLVDADVDISSGRDGF